MKKFIEAYKDFISSYDPFSEGDQLEDPADMICNLKEIKKDMLENETVTDDPELWELLNKAITAYN